MRKCSEKASITNRDEYQTNPILTSDAHDYNLTATLFGKEWALYDDFWMRHVHVKVTARCDAHCPFCIEKNSHIEENGEKLTANLEQLLSELDAQQMDGSPMTNTERRYDTTKYDPNAFHHIYEIKDDGEREWVDSYTSEFSV